MEGESPDSSGDRGEGWRNCNLFCNPPCPNMYCWPGREAQQEWEGESPDASGDEGEGRRSRGAQGPPSASASEEEAYRSPARSPALESGEEEGEDEDERRRDRDREVNRVGNYLSS